MIANQSADALCGRLLAGRYRIGSVLGRGGMGVVYVAEDERTAKTVVVKTLPSHLCASESFVRRFEREAERMRGLSSHPNIVELLETQTLDGNMLIVMEYVDGEPLSKFLARHGPLPLSVFTPIASQLLKAVGHAHQHGVILRDIKPDNLMVCERSGRALYLKLLDFGLARTLHDADRITKEGLVGTAEYLAPEFIADGPVELCADVYSLGVVFYEMLCGETPFRADSVAAILYQHVNKEPPSLAERLPADTEVPQALIELITECLQKSADGRPCDAHAVMERMIDIVPHRLFRLPPAVPRAAPTTKTDELMHAARAAQSMAASPAGAPQSVVTTLPVRDSTPAVGSIAALGDADAEQGHESAGSLVGEPSLYSATEVVELPRKRSAVTLLGLSPVAVVAAAVLWFGFRGGEDAPPTPESSADNLAVANHLDGTFAPAQAAEGEPSRAGASAEVVEDTLRRVNDPGRMKDTPYAQRRDDLSVLQAAGVGYKVDHDLHASLDLQQAGMDADPCAVFGAALAHLEAADGLEPFGPALRSVHAPPSPRDPAPDGQELTSCEGHAERLAALQAALKPTRSRAPRAAARPRRKARARKPEPRPQVAPQPAVTAPPEKKPSKPPKPTVASVLDDGLKPMAN